MKQKIFAGIMFVALASCIALFVATIRSNQRGNGEQQKALNDLREKLDRLQQSASTLEKRLGEIQMEKQTMADLPEQIVPLPYHTFTNQKPRVLPPGTPIEDIPPGSAFEFNGRIYHLTPLAQNSQSSRREAK